MRSHLSRRSLLTGLGGTFGMAVCPLSAAQSESAAESLFAVEIKVGPRWDPTKPPAEQAFFREHSATLKRWRDNGRILLGARYGDKGLLIFKAASKQELQDLLTEDPAQTAGTFVAEVFLLNVFYDGSVPVSRRSR